MNRDSRLDAFRHHNPFLSSSVGDPWDNTYPDVASINQHAFYGLCELIEQKTALPSLNCAGMILGEVGSGKTHLLSRFLHHSKQVQWPFAFAYIQPIEDPEQPYRYLLREIMVNLCQPIAPGQPPAPHTQATQLRKLATRVFQEGCHQVDLKPPYVVSRAQFLAIQEEAIARLTLLYPRLSSRFVKMLLHYTIPEQRSAALHWLSGHILDASEVALLQVPDRSQATPAALEEEARELLLSLGLLLGHYHQPLVVCFDRLENLERDEHIAALGKMVEFLVDKARAMLPIVCFRGLQWEERGRQQCNQHISSRLETNKFELQGCTAEQALEIIRSRLSCVPGYDASAPFFPFNREDLLHTFRMGFYSPRGVITLANRRLRQILEEGPPLLVSSLQTLQDAFTSQYRTIVEDMERYQPDRGRLRRTMELLLRYSQVVEEATLNCEDRYFDAVLVPQDSATAPTVVLVDIDQHHTAVGTRLTRGSTFLQEKPEGRVIYVRDGRCPIPTTWQATYQKLEMFQALGGQVVFLEPEQAAAWYALALLSYAVREGDVTRVDAADQVQPIALEELATFIKDVLAGQQHPAFLPFFEALHASRGAVLGRAGRRAGARGHGA